MRALGFEPKKEEIQKMISDVDVPWTKNNCRARVGLEGAVDKSLRAGGEGLGGACLGHVFFFCLRGGVLLLAELGGGGLHSTVFF